MTQQIILTLTQLAFLFLFYLLYKDISLIRMRLLKLEKKRIDDGEILINSIQALQTLCKTLSDYTIKHERALEEMQRQECRIVQ